MRSSLCRLPSFPAIMMAMPYKLIFNTALPFPNQIHSSLPHPSLLTVMDGGLHPFIAFTYFSAHPLNDTHSYTLTLHPSFPPSSSNSCSFPSFFYTHPQRRGFHFFVQSNTPPSTILCTLLPFSCLFLSLPLAFSLFPRPSFVVRFHTQYRYHSSLSFLYIFG